MEIIKSVKNYFQDTLLNLSLQRNLNGEAWIRKYITSNTGVFAYGLNKIIIQHIDGSWGDVSTQAAEWQAAVRGRGDYGSEVIVFCASTGTNRIGVYSGSWANTMFHYAAPAANAWSAIAHHNGRFIIVSTNGTKRSAFSTNGGYTWTLNTTMPNYEYVDIFSLNSGVFIAVGINSGSIVFVKTTDGGINWTAAPSTIAALSASKPELVSPYKRWEGTLNGKFFVLINENGFSPIEENTEFKLYSSDDYINFDLVRTISPQRNPEFFEKPSTSFTLRNIRINGSYAYITNSASFTGFVSITKDFVDVKTAHVKYAPSKMIGLTDYGKMYFLEDAGNGGSGGRILAARYSDE